MVFFGKSEVALEFQSVNYLVVEKGKGAIWVG